MKRITALAALLLAASLLAGIKIHPAKAYSNRPAKRHPYIQKFSPRRDFAPDRKASGYNKLLVILVDFQAETTDDVNTTGDGKFQLAPDLSYLYPVASPPHNRQYFLNNLEALRHYYLAASMGSYNLEYEVYPQTGAYTLPQTLGYYNPPGADGDLFVSRMEEYFQAAFELADSLSPEIDFAQYGHYMIIHAGSDWQHDVFGDTPSDLPSFFINVGEGKEAVVDGGAVLIRNACNVPATISQDFSTQVSGEQTYHSGYGALNAVIAHEFGHSLGMKDLYNVYNWQPMVGVFDIMDSGGSGVLVDVLNDGSYVMVEGALPVLPGAWSRTLLFGEHFQSSGYLQDIGQIDLFEPLNLAAASHMQSGSAVVPEILRIPLAPGEYILVENRNVDPDGDGGTAVFATPDSRVILYPTTIAGSENNPTYEYDYLLPSFQKADGSAIGGGILVWRVNDDVIYEQGVTDSEGNWVSNYDNNSINTRYAERGVEVIEADNLPDIGYNWSWYWTGTQYEYFHHTKPILDGQGFFVDWSLDEWKPSLNAETKPPLLDSRDQGSLYWLSGIGNPGATMNLTVRSGFFNNTEIFAYNEPGLLPGPVINSSFSDMDIPLISEDSIRLLSKVDNEWTDLMGELPWNGQSIDYPVISTDQDANNFKELVMVHGSALELVEFSSDALQSHSINFPSAITTTPLALNDTLYVSTANSLSAVRDGMVAHYNQIQGIKRLGSYCDDLVALCSDLLYILDPATLVIESELELAEPFGDYEPVTFTAERDDVRMLFLMANSGNVYKYQDSQLQLIFQNTDSCQPTQMGLTTWVSYWVVAVNPVLFWACGNKIYAVKHDGTLVQGHPYNAYPLEFTPYQHVYALWRHPHLYLQLPVSGKGHVAYAIGEGLQWQNSLVADSVVLGSTLLTDPVDELYQNLFWYYAEQDGTLSIHRAQEYANAFYVVWNGFRNGGTGSYAGLDLYDMQGPYPKLVSYVYPNPVRNSSFRVRIGDFSQDVKYDIYDINATLVQSGFVPTNGILERDIMIDSSKLSSGVYILNVRSGDRQQRLKFAVEK